MRLSVLIVDDDESKRRTVSEIISRVVYDQAYIELAVNVSDAFRRIRARQFDLVVLDLCIPMRDGEMPKPDSGLSLLTALNRKDVLTPSHVVGLSEFADLVNEQRHEFESKLWHIIKYDRSGGPWIDQLEEKVRHIADVGAPHNKYHTDLAVITAVEQVELAAVLTAPFNWQQARTLGDPTVYWRGHCTTPSHAYSVVAASATEMGMAAASCIATKLVYQFRPKIIASVGIAAGIGCKMCDVLVADHCWDYGSGKFVEDGTRLEFQQRPSQIQIDPEIKARLSAFIRRGGAVERSLAQWKGRRSANLAPTIRMGPIATGAAVLASKSVIDSIRRQNAKVIGVEMEAYGVFAAARLSSTPRPSPLCIKGVSDRGVRGKGDRHQRLAAHLASSTLFEFANDFFAHSSAE